MISEVKQIIANEKLVPVVKLDNPDDAVPLMNALMAGGINVAEITYRTKAGGPSIEKITAEIPNALVGAGTIVNATQCQDAIKRGARFIVSPGFDRAIAAVCRAEDVLYIPGCVTPTEIMMAIAEDLDIIKFFPAENFGGVKTIKALAAPFGGIKFMPTGGVSAENVRAYLDSGKVVACGGSWMVKSDLITGGDFAKITALAKEAKDIVNA